MLRFHSVFIKVSVLSLQRYSIFSVFIHISLEHYYLDLTDNTTE